MTIRRLLMVAAGGASFIAPDTVSRLALYNGTIDAGITYAIGAATFDGATWTKEPTNPVLEQGAGGQWDEDGVKDPALVWDGSQFVAYYSGYTFSGADPGFRIGRATAAAIDGPWTKDAGNPVIDVGGGGSDDESDAQAPSVFYSNQGIGGHDWWMWYVGTDSGAVGHLLLAHSDDGITWTKDGEVDAVGPVVRHGGTFYMLATSNGLNLWTFSTPTGTYTPDGGNPLLERRGLVADTSPNLSADAALGATSLTVASGDADGLEIGEPLFIVDANDGPEINRVDSVSSTSIGLVNPTIDSYQVAGGATARTMAYTIIDARSLLRMSDGTWEAYGTTFRPGDGLTFSGNPLWEGSLRYTAPDVTGPWSYDFDTGLIFPLTTLGAAWDSVSAENMSVIRLP